jgi:tRNA (adenine37-N6)-methyltransferase
VAILFRTLAMIQLDPIGHVSNARRDSADDDWGKVESSITLVPTLEPAALAGLADFSHAEILFLFDRVSAARIETGARHPRNNRAWPAVGIFAQRGKNRPNRLGLTSVEILRVDGRVLTVRGLDAIDGTPILDIKPVMREFLPRGEIRQPGWVSQLMAEYWTAAPSP